MDARESKNFADWLAAQLGTQLWCVASRATPKLREKYEVILRPHIFKAYQSEFNRQLSA